MVIGVYVILRKFSEVGGYRQEESTSPQEGKEGG
ncbi:hypothetical protein SPLC1_S542930 [Arthrospira platensis C1]|uniref:Uncharacterized protein n=1 Tax=Limnospira maxima CS-328 TaxID=513049 RepID=B5W3V6_LIMMA|nr:hypothetical protein AmaxDRAFT_3454 [Limnospira maxima CS-328]EKD06348.1 hypothetical protein SPLC1_S542930 [Arthrospira platensis C1]